MTDLVISGNSCYINCWCTRWDTDNYNIVLETFMNKSDLQDLRNSIIPGAVKQLYRILGVPYFVDATWSKENTIQLIPNSNTQLDRMRGKNYTAFPKNITTSPLEGDKGWIWCKLDCTRSGNSLI